MNKDFDKWEADNDNMLILEEAEMMFAAREDGDAAHYRYHKLLDKARKRAYEAGQRVKSTLPYWIPVTERIPTEKDGKIGLFAGHDAVNVFVKKYVNKKCCYGFCPFFLDTKEFLLKDIISWQPIPEE